MDGMVVTLDGVRGPATADFVRGLLEKGDFFWLDLENLDAEALGLFRDAFCFHPLAVEDAEHFGQRPKIDEYDDFALMVVYGAGPDGLIELHCFYSERYLVTVHHQPCPDLHEVAERVLRRPPRGGGALVLHHVVDKTVDSFFPVLEKMDDHIDSLEEAILREPTDAQLAELLDLKRELVRFRKAVTPERDMFAALVSGAYELVEVTDEVERYFRDIYDHLIRISDLVDSYRDLVSGVLDAHLATVSNRLNVVMKQLAIIATIFLPLSFLTGFFGQNFGWLVSRLTSLPVFLGAGLGLELLAVVGLLWLFHHRGWIGDGRRQSPRPRRSAGRGRRPG